MEATDFLFFVFLANASCGSAMALVWDENNKNQIPKSFGITKSAPAGWTDDLQPQASSHGIGGTWVHSAQAFVWMGGRG